MEKKKSVLICLLVAVAVIILLVLIVSLQQPKGFPVMEYKNQKFKIGAEYKQSDLEEKYGHADEYGSYIHLGSFDSPVAIRAKDNKEGTFILDGWRIEGGLATVDGIGIGDEAEKVRSKYKSVRESDRGDEISVYFDKDGNLVDDYFASEDDGKEIDWERYWDSYCLHFVVEAEAIVEISCFPLGKD